MDPHDDDLIVSPSCCGSETVKVGSRRHCLPVKSLTKTDIVTSK